MIDLSFLSGKSVAVMGLGKSGLASAHALSAAGARILAWDDKEEKRTLAAGKHFEIYDLYHADWSKIDLLMWSPGIPHRSHLVAIAANAAGIRPVCDIELLTQACPLAKFIAITGTNGKSTTTSLIAHLLSQSGMRTRAGGNLGPPALDLEPLGKDDVYVLEISSYQAELLDKSSFDVVVMLNISPDHLAYHGGLDGYIRAKSSLFDRLRPKGTAIIGVDDYESCRLYQQLSDLKGLNLVPISSIDNLTQGVSASDGLLTDANDKSVRFDIRNITTLLGQHNWQNASASYAAARSLGISPEKILTALTGFGGLEHRQERIAVIDGVTYINDSKATNADAAAKALACHDNIFWILGGQAKEGGIASLESYFPRIRHAFLIGEAADSFAQTLEGKVPYRHCHSLDRAVEQASLMAKNTNLEKRIVLLSPACASWDQFTSFEHRGAMFRKLVSNLARQMEPL